MWCCKKKKETKERRITADEYKKSFETSNDEQNMQVKNDGTAPYSKLEKALRLQSGQENLREDYFGSVPICLCCSPVRHLSAYIP